MPRFDPTGWERISKPCPDCGIDQYYVKAVDKIEDTETMDIKQFHRQNCPQLAKISGSIKSPYVNQPQ